MEVDTVYSVIGRIVSSKNIYLPPNYVEIPINDCLPTQPYTVNHVDHTFFKR